MITGAVMKALVFSRSFFTSVFILLALMTTSAKASQGLPDFTKLVQQSSPAVVNISTTQTIKSKGHLPKGFKMPDIPEDSPFHDFFKHFFDDQNGEGGSDSPEYDAKSLGSGFIISSDGYILTNEHVVRDADEILVRLTDRREFKAKLIGKDTRSDIAVLKIDANNLPVVKIGKSEDLQVGEWVLAIGSPFGFDASVTAGIVSAKGRSLPRENYVPFIQTDVAINPGNSGGPLFNMKGEVVGINSQIYSRTGGFMGLSFSIPIEVAMDVANQLKTKGKVSRGWLGVLIQDVTAELAESFDMNKPRGALVSRVLPDSPAEKAGIQVGDIIVGFNEHAIPRSKDLPPLVGKAKVGKRVPLKVIRNGKTKFLYVVLGELPEESQLKLAGKAPKAAEVDRVGLVVTDLTAEQRKALDIPKNGVVVSRIKRGAASHAGIVKGDVILMMNNIDVKNAQHFEKMIKGYDAGQSVPVLVQRRDGPIFLAMKIDDK
jgi:serine protease Do